MLSLFHNNMVLVAALSQAPGWCCNKTNFNSSIAIASSPGSLHGFTGNTGWGAARKKESLVRTVRACANFLIAENTWEQKEMTLVDVKLHGRGLTRCRQHGSFQVIAEACCLCLNTIHLAHHQRKQWWHYQYSIVVSVKLVVEYDGRTS